VKGDHDLSKKKKNINLNKSYIYNSRIMRSYSFVSAGAEIELVADHSSAALLKSHVVNHITHSNLANY